MSYPVDNPIQPGDVFVKQWGQREIIWLALPRSERSAKQPWLRLHLGTLESSYHTSRYHLTGSRGAQRKHTFWFVGTIPEWFLKELLTNYDW